MQVQAAGKLCYRQVMILAWCTCSEDEESDEEDEAESGAEGEEEEDGFEKIKSAKEKKKVRCLNLEQSLLLQSIVEATTEDGRHPVVSNTHSIVSSLLNSGQRAAGFVVQINWYAMNEVP